MKPISGVRGMCRLESYLYAMLANILIAYADKHINGFGIINSFMINHKTFSSIR